jgi:hypothetical protein
MHAPQRPVELFYHSAKWQPKCRPPSDQHIIMSRPHSSRSAPSHNLPQAAANAIALDGVADLLRHGKANPHRTTIPPFTGLQYERRRRRLGAACGCQEIRAMPQSLHGVTRVTAPSLRTEPLAPARASGGNHPAAALGGHAGAESVTALAHQLARLIGPLHGIVLRLSRRSGRWRNSSAGAASLFGARYTSGWRRDEFCGLIREPPLIVNATTLCKVLTIFC